MKKIVMSDNMSKRLLGLFGILLLILGWQWLSTSINDQSMLPTPISVCERFAEVMVEPVGAYTLPFHIGISLGRVLIAFSIACALGIVLGLSMAWSRGVRAAVNPIFEFLRPIPPLAWIPMAILWFGIGETTKYFIIFIATFPTILLNTFEGARRVDPVLVGASQMLGASPTQTFFTIVFPSSVPQIFAGIQVAISSGWMAVLAAEMVRSSEGAGWLIIRGMEVGDTTQILVGMIAIGVVGFMLVSVTKAMERSLCRWNVQGI